MPWKVPKLSADQKRQRVKEQSHARVRNFRAVDTAQRNADIAVIDFETDPFDAASGLVVRPFLAVIHSRQFPDIIIWDEDADELLRKVVEAIETLPRHFTIYAHNGGKFDYMFLVNRIRGEVMFKGRGFMSFRIGDHELRDSFHIIPEKLASYKKDDFDYTTLRKGRREKHRASIIEYCLNDCKYLLDIVLSFIAKFGRKLSIGQAAQSKVREAGYVVSKFNDQFDAFLRSFYFGGRVECLGGIGHFVSDPEKPYRLYDVNSMYPDAMVRYQHPIGAPSDFTIRTGEPGAYTFFVHLRCENYGALVSRMEDGSTSATKERGEFYTTIHEYKIAKELGLIDQIEIISCVDCEKTTNFERFIMPAYDNRLKLKPQLKALEAQGDTDSFQYLDLKKEDMMWKFLLNNAYGKYAQNPRRFKECYITAIGERPPNDPERTYGDMPVYEDFLANYAIWERPQKRLSFNNVSTAASITGAARATLLRGIACADAPIYCDTDSIICTGMTGVEIDPTKLGAWDVEATYKEVIIAGKKLYAAMPYKGKPKIRMKGSSGAEWDDFKLFLEGRTKTYTMKGPTMTRTGRYQYMQRQVRATGSRTGNVRLLTRKG